MGYDLHIHREKGEIAPAEIEAVAEFELQDGLYGTNAKTGEEMSLGGPFAIWTDPAHTDGVPFMVGHGGLTVKYANEDTLALALEVAKRLGGRVHGDDGEFYDEPPPKPRRFGLFRRS